MYAYVRACVCMCMCVKLKGKTERQREREYVCVFGASVRDVVLRYDNIGVIFVFWVRVDG
jgi:hypothetical protein